LGITAWVDDGETTKAIGRSGPEYTGSDGTKQSIAFHLNEVGQIAGYSLRSPLICSNLGHDAWLYDPALEETFSVATLRA
jgi:hypothetical protein